MFNLFGDDEVQILPSQDTRLVDTDTIKTETGNNVRLGGVDARESSHIIYDDFGNPVAFKAGDVAGDLTTSYAQQLHDDEGFNTPVLYGYKDALDKRDMGDEFNPEGDRYSTRLLETGLADLTIDSDEGQVLATIGGRLERAKRKANGEMNKYDLALEHINQTKLSQEGVRAKEMLADEVEMAAVLGALRKQGKDLGMDEVSINSFVKDRMDTYGITDRLVQIRKYDRKLNNEATSTLKSGIAMASSGIAEGYYGTLDMIGDMVDIDLGGHSNLARLAREKDFAPILPNQNAFDEKGNWQLESATQVTNWLWSNMVLSAPYMAQSMVASILAAPTFGLSLAFPAATYIGQTYNEQPEGNKNPLAAIFTGTGMAALDILGVRAIVPKALYGFTLKPAIAKQVAEIVAKENKIPLPLAETMVANASMKALAQSSQAAKEALAAQFSHKYIAGKGLQATVVNGAEEALTETGQEILGLLGANGFDLSEVDEGEIRNRLLNASVAGFALGGTMGGTGATYSGYRQKALIAGYDQANMAKADQDIRLREEYINQKVGNNDTPENRARVEDQYRVENIIDETINLDKTAPDLTKQAGVEARHRKNRSIFTQASDFIKERGIISGQYKGYMQTNKERFGDRGEYMAKYFSLYGVSRIFKGNNIFEDQLINERNLLNDVGQEAQFSAAFGKNNSSQASAIMNDPRLKETIKDVVRKLENGKYQAVKDAFANNDAIALPQDLQAYQEPIMDYIQKVYDYARRRQQLTGDQNLNVMDVFNRRAFRKREIAANPDQFKAAVIAAGVSVKQAQRLLREILEQDVNSPNDMLEENFDVLNMDDTLDMANIDRTKLFKSPEMSKFMSDNLFYNLNADASATAARVTAKKYINNGRTPAYLLQKAFEAGEIDRREMSFLAQETIDFIDIRKGTYKQIKNETAKAFQQNALLFTTMNQLTLAPVSSIVELGLITNSIPMETLFGKNGLNKLVKTTAGEIYNYYNLGVTQASHALGKGEIKRSDKMSDTQQDIFELGMLQESMNMAHRHDINVGVVNQRWTDAYFQVTGLQSMTNITRSARAALGGDAIRGFLDDIEYTGEFTTKQALFAKDYLSYLGMDYDFMVRTHKADKEGVERTPGIQAKYEQEMMRALFNFVNDAVAHPNKINRPKIYYNPRFALFFQFQGFISSITSTIVPRLYKNVFGSQTPPAARMDAIATMVMMIALGFLAMYLKDLIKFGEEPSWLDDEKKFYRAIYASGLLGTGERLLSHIFPVYNFGGKDGLESVLNEVGGQAPSLAYGMKLTGAANETFQALFGIEREKGKDATAESAAYKWLRAGPVTGPLTSLDKTIANSLFGE